MAYQTFIDPNAQPAFQSQYQNPYQQVYPNTFGYSYQPYPQPRVAPAPAQAAPQPQTPQAPSRNVYDWVQGDNAAKAYPLGAGQSIILIDPDAPFMFQKSTDVTGKPQQLKYFSVNEITEEEYKAYFNGQNTTQQEPVDLSAYVRKDEIERIVSDATSRAIEQKMSEMSFRATTTSAKAQTTQPVIIS